MKKSRYNILILLKYLLMSFDNHFHSFYGNLVVSHIEFGIPISQILKR